MMLKIFSSHPTPFLATLLLSYTENYFLVVFQCLSAAWVFTILSDQILIESKTQVKIPCILGRSGLYHVASLSKFEYVIFGTFHTFSSIFCPLSWSFHCLVHSGCLILFPTTPKASVTSLLSITLDRISWV